MLRHGKRVFVERIKRGGVKRFDPTVVELKTMYPTIGDNYAKGLAVQICYQRQMQGLFAYTDEESDHFCLDRVKVDTIRDSTVADNIALLGV